jgi:hypothetical protein
MLLELGHLQTDWFKLLLMVEEEQEIREMQELQVMVVLVGMEILEIRPAAAVAAVAAEGRLYLVVEDHLLRLEVQQVEMVVLRDLHLMLDLQDLREVVAVPP